MSYKLAGVEWNEDGTMKTKQLSPLEALEKIKTNLIVDGYDTQNVLEHISIIEKAHLFMDLEQEHKIGRIYNILIEKEIDVWLVKHCDYENYCRIRTKCLETNVECMADCDKPAIPLPTEEEYKLLKEVLV